MHAIHPSMKTMKNNNACIHTNHQNVYNIYTHIYYVGIYIYILHSLFAKKCDYSLYDVNASMILLPAKERSKFRHQGYPSISFIRQTIVCA